jgi:hypothetical protein
MARSSICVWRSHEFNDLKSQLKREKAKRKSHNEG